MSITKQTDITRLTTEERKNLACSMYLAGKPLSEIPNAAIGSCNAIYKILRENGISHRLGVRTKPNNRGNITQTPTGRSRTCSRCGEIKDNIYFPELRNGKNQSWCNACHASHKRFIRYGASEEIISQLIKTQDGKCGLCPRPLVKYHVDHNPRTGLVRGLLCGSCNTRLGGWDDHSFRKVALDWLDKGGTLSGVDDRERRLT